MFVNGRVLLALLAGLSASFVVPQSRPTPKQSLAAIPDEIRARSFVVVDKEGQERACLGVLDDGMARLELRAGAGQRGVYIEGTPSGFLRIAFTRADGLALTELGVSEDDTQVLIFRDDKGGRRFGASCSATGAVGIQFKDQAGKERLAASLGKDGAPILKLFDENGKPRTALLVTQQGGSALDMLDEHGTTRVSVAEIGDLPNITLFKRDGTPQWSTSKLDGRKQP